MWGLKPLVILYKINNKAGVELCLAKVPFTSTKVSGVRGSEKSYH